MNDDGRVLCIVESRRDLFFPMPHVYKFVTTAAPLSEIFNDEMNRMVRSYWIGNRAHAHICVTNMQIRYSRQRIKDTDWFALSKKQVEELRALDDQALWLRFRDGA